MFGFGYVGQGVHEILTKNQETLEERTKCQIEISKIVVRSPEKYKDVPMGHAVLSSDPNDILQDDSIDIVVELMGGEYPAFDYICAALKAKKHVVTANKEVVAKHKKTFFDLAQENGVMIYFEAAIAGSIPLIRTLKVGYGANEFQSISGIFNGTTNYILTKIQEEKKIFCRCFKRSTSGWFC